MTASHDDRLVRHIVSTLDQSVRDIDPVAQEKLNTARREAVTSARAEHFLARAAKASLDNSVSNLPPDIVSRLNTARQTALDTQEQISPTRVTEPKPAGTLASWFRHQWNRYRLSWSAGAFATACVVITATSVLYLDPEQSVKANEDIVLFASSEEIELYENLEFYLWLADNGLTE